MNFSPLPESPEVLSVGLWLPCLSLLSLWTALEYRQGSVWEAAEGWLIWPGGCVWLQHKERERNWCGVLVWGLEAKKGAKNPRTPTKAGWAAPQRTDFNTQDLLTRRENLSLLGDSLTIPQTVENLFKCTFWKFFNCRSSVCGNQEGTMWSKTRAYDKYSTCLS